MFALISANLVNWLFNWLLIEGHWGFPPLHVVGSALSTCLARVYMAAVLAFFIWWFEREAKPGFRNVLQPPDTKRLKTLLRIGFPAATQILLEISAFGAAAVLAGRLTAAALAGFSSNRAEYRGAHVYGSAWHCFRGGGCCGPSDRSRHAGTSQAIGLYRHGT